MGRLASTARGVHGTAPSTAVSISGCRKARRSSASVTVSSATPRLRMPRGNHLVVFLDSPPDPSAPKAGYMHLSVRRQTGDRVSEGQVIGRSGNTGHSTGPHLHFWMGNNANVGAVDPTPFFSTQVLRSQSRPAQPRLPDFNLLLAAIAAIRGDNAVAMVPDYFGNEVSLHINKNGDLIHNSFAATGGRTPADEVLLSGCDPTIQPSARVANENLVSRASGRAGTSAAWCSSKPKDAGIRAQPDRSRWLASPARSRPGSRRDPRSGRCAACRRGRSERTCSFAPACERSAMEVVDVVDRETEGGAVAVLRFVARPDPDVEVEEVVVRPDSCLSTSLPPVLERNAKERFPELLRGVEFLR